MDPARAKGQGRAEALRWWSAAELASLERVLADRTRAWMAGWMPRRQMGSLQVSCLLAWSDPELARAAWRGLGRGSLGSAWVEGDDDPVHSMAVALFGQPGPIASAVGAHALEAWYEALRALLGPASLGNESPRGDPSFLPWSGCVVVSFHLGAPWPSRILLDGDCVAALCPRPRQTHKPRQPLVPIDQACEQHAVRAKVRLASFELDLGTLASLEAGDILAVPHGLEIPLEVHAFDSVLCAAYLGRTGDMKAVELTPASSTSHGSPKP